jgi:hypothetical protein
MRWLMKSFLFFVLLGVSVDSIAQDEDCELSITRANDEFNAGHFYSIPTILNNCLEKFTREQRQRAYMLLTQAYLLIDDSRGAKQSYLEILKANPEFQADSALHSIDVIYLSKKFTASPIFSFFIKGGTNTSLIRTIYDLNAYGDPKVKEKYNLRLGYQAGAGADYGISDKWSARGELNYIVTAYHHQTTNYFTNTSKSLTDKQGWLTIPISITYTDVKGRYRPYGYLGYSLGLLLSDKANIQISSNEGFKESPVLDFKYKRNNLNQSILVGGGLKTKIGLDYVFVDLRYSFGLKNIVKENSNYGDYNGGQGNFLKTFDPVVTYTQVDDYFRLDNLAITVGFLRPLYKPRELKKARTKSVMRSLKSK